MLCKDVGIRLTLPISLLVFGYWIQDSLCIPLCTLHTSESAALGNINGTDIQDTKYSEIKQHLIFHMSWQNSFFECFSPLESCMLTALLYRGRSTDWPWPLGCLATWCPCVIYGKSRALQERTSDESPSGCNGSVSHCSKSSSEFHRILDEAFATLFQRRHWHFSSSAAAGAFSPPAIFLPSCNAWIAAKSGTKITSMATLAPTA